MRVLVLGANRQLGSDIARVQTEQSDTMEIIPLLHQTFDVSHTSATWFEFAREIISQAGIPARATPVTSQEFPTVAVRPSYSILSNEKASKITGPIPHWRDALNRYLSEKGHLTAGVNASRKS